MYQNSKYSFSMPKPYQTVAMPKTFPEDIECIVKAKDTQIGSIFISNVQAASNPVTLKKLKIGAILTCAKGYEQKHPKSLVPHYKYIQAVDHQECNISIYFEEAVDFIQDSLKKTNILVHCIAGVSRSVSMVIAYFIRQHQMAYDQAYRLVKSKRKIIHPNDGFIAQLKQFQKKVKMQENKSRGRSQGERSIEKEITFEKYQDNFYLDKTMPTLKSKEIAPSRSPAKEYLQKYQSNQFNRYSYSSKQPEVPVSLQFIPNHSYQKIDYDKSKVLTPKAKKIEDPNDKYSYGFNRSMTTNFYTPAKSIPRNVNMSTAYTHKNHEDHLSGKLQRPTTTSPQMKSYNTQQSQAKFTSPQGTQPEKKRQELFSSMNNDLNNKIQKIRQKYQLQRQKLFNKYQTFQKDNSSQDRKDKFQAPYQSKYNLNYQKKYNLDQYKYQDKHEIKHGTSYKHYTKQYPKGYENLYSKTDSKNHSMPRKSFQNYEIKNYRAPLNEQENFYHKKLQGNGQRNSFYKANEYSGRKYNDLGSSRYDGYISTKTYGLSYYDKPYQFLTSDKRYL